MTRWKYRLVAVVLVSRLVELSLYYVSEISDGSWYLFTGGWFVMLLLALRSLFRLRWRELVIYSLVLVVTASPTFRIGDEPIAGLQEGAARLYALYRIRSVPLDQFLSTCKLIDYTESDGSKGKVGECHGFRSTVWFRPSVIYDPTGQFALPPKSRTRAWRWAVWDLSAGAFLAANDHDDAHIFGNFYFVLIPHEAEDG